MSFTEWSNAKKKKKDEESSKQDSSVTTPKTNSGSSGGVSSGTSFSAWSNAKKGVKTTISAGDWFQSGNDLLDEVQQYYSNWHGKDDARHTDILNRVEGMLSNADYWRKQYEGDKDAVSAIDSMVSALSSVSSYAYQNHKYFSQWESEEEYNDYLSYMEDYNAKKSFDLDAGQKEIDELKAIEQEYSRYGVAKDRNPYIQEKYQQYFDEYGDIKSLRAQISEKTAYLNQAKRIQEGITLSGVVDNADFEANSGYVSTESDSKWKKASSQYGLGYDDLVYEYINGGQNGMREEILSKNTVYNADNALDSRDKWTVYDNMTESEIAIYNYHYAKEGKKAADKYLKSIEETLNYRKATSMYSEMEDNTALELAFGIVAGLDQFESGVKNLLNTEDDYIAQTAYQMASGMVREDLEDASIPMWYNAKTGKWENKILGYSAGQIAYDAITTIANMAPSILTSMAVGMINPMAGQVIGTGLMGASAAGNDYQQMLNLGYSKDQARIHSTLVGASEAGLQYFLGGIGALGGEVSSKALTTFMNGIDNAFHRTSLTLAGKMASEGFEEGLQEILTTWFTNLTMHTDENVNWSEVAYSSLLGALTAGFMEGPSTIAGEVNTYKTGKQVKDAGITAHRLSVLGTTYSADTVAYQLAGRVNEHTGAYTIGRLFNELGATLTEQNVADITEALVAKGMDRNTAVQNARAMATVVEGGNLTDLQVAIIESNEILAEAMRTTIIDPNATWFQRTKVYNNMLMELAQEKASPNATSGKQTKSVEQIVYTGDNVDFQKKSGSGVSSEAVTEADDSPAKAQSISNIQKGQVTVKLEDGSEVNLRDADLDPDDGITIETIASIDGISAADANFILNTLKTSPGATAQVSALGAKEAYKYGYYGFSQEHIAKHGVFANSLNETQRQAIYETGRKARESKVAEKQVAVAKNATTSNKDSNKNATTEKSSVTGKVHFEGDRSTLTKRQSASLTAMEKVAEVLGVQIYVFESELNEKGQRVGANGWYDPNDNSIHIDLHAGATGEGTMMFTMAHELTHHIRKWSPAKFKILADFLMEEYGKKGVNVDALVRAQMEKAWKTRKRRISYDVAFEEVVADSMETMLADGNVLNRLEKLRAKDESLWKEIKRFINDLAAKIRSVYKGLKPDSMEGRYVAEMGKAVYRLQEMFAEALVDASENYQASEHIGIEIDADTESVSPALLLSERTWTESDYVQEREKAAEEIAKAIGVSKKKAEAYINSVNSIAKMIAEDRVRLDYFSSPGRSSFVGNVEYGGSFDFSTLCKKRRLLTGTFTAIQKALPNTALTADEILDIRNRMKAKGLEVSCGLCYVEGSRANMGQFAKEFLRLYKQYYPDAWQPNMADVNTPDGIEWVRINHPECYEQYEYFWNHYGTLKPGDKNLFASQQKPKLYQLHTEYKGEILEKFKDDGIEEKNLNGGIRLQSFSDFEIVHLIDTMQIIMDMSRVGLAGQAYTKVPDFAWALGDTGLKINLSLIAKGVDENGKLIFDDVEGMPIETAVELRNRYSKNVGTILVAFNDEQLLAAMADDRVDYIIPFHRSQWKKSQYAAMGLPAKTKDYTYMQNEKFIKPQYHEYRGRMVKDKATNYMPNEYWDFSKSGKENAIAYLEMCARNNKRPKFYKLLQNNGDGSYSLKADGSTDGYWKLLIDFKMYDNDGNGSPQMPVRPDFNMEEATRMLDSYKGGHSNFPVAQGIVDEFVKDYKDSHKDVLYSDRVTDQDTLDFLNEQLRNGEVTKVYRAMQAQPVDENGNVIKATVLRVVSQSPLMVEAKTFGKNGKVATYPAKLFSPMAGVVNGKWSKSIELNEWEETSFDLANATTQIDKKTGKPKIDNDKKNASYGEVAYFYGLVKGGIDDSGKKLTDVPARYNPYIHTSLSALNDQFSSANKRPELVTVECIVPNSELTSGFRAEGAKDRVGAMSWHSGPTSSRLAKVGKARTVILTRYDMPVRVLPDSEVAKAVAEYIGDTENIAIKGSTVTPSLASELMNLGISVLNEEQWSQYDNDFPTKTFGKKKNTAGQTLYSDRNNAPTFYSQMAKVVDGVKQEKLGASSVVSMLRGKGVKAEEIKWSGIEEWLEGKKSVTKAELQEFIAGSMLQIEEETLTNDEIPYTEDQQKRIAEYTANRDEIAQELAEVWKQITGDDIPITNFGAGLESSVESKIRDVNLDEKKASFEGRLLEKLRKDLKEVIANNDDFGFDSGREALISIHRHRKSFIDHYELSTADKAVIVKYCNALNAYNELPNKINELNTIRLRKIAHEAELYNRKIGGVKSEHYAENAKHMTKWGQYKLKGGENYREILFKIPGSSYYNEAMDMHWDERSGILAHARIQDLNTFLGKMLFVEELQSDWHNEGHKIGYRNFTNQEATVDNTTVKLVDGKYVLYRNGISLEESLSADVAARRQFSEERIHQGLVNNFNQHIAYDTRVPDAPFKDTYHEYVLKRLLREAAEQDYDSIGWTPAEIQVKRWSEKFAEGYRIEYDQDIPKFLNKYGKKWGTKVGKTVLDSGTEVWSMAITDEMKESVLTEGQPLYSDRVLMGSLFSGGGTLEAGLAYQMLDKQFGVEYDGKIASVYADNHGDHIQVGRVEDFDISKYEDIFYLHASPVCHNFSKAKHGAKELQMDIDSAKATAKHLETAMPKVFTVENAPGYRKSESLKIITDKLTELGYKWDVDVYNSADYGSATSRNRVILRAVKDGELPPKPDKQARANSWDKATRDLWDTLPKATLRPSFISAIENTTKLPILDANGKVNVNKPLLILTTTSGHTVTFCWEGEICPTLTTKCGEARLVMPDGNIYAVTPEFMGRIQGLPDDYKYPKEKTRAFTIIGNGIPTHLTKAVVGGVLDSAYEQSHDGQKLYSERDTESVSNRSLLANAFEGLAQNDIERNKIQEYKSKIDLINAEEKKLRELNAQIKELSFGEGKRDTKKLNDLRFDAQQAANRINTFDKQLLRLEASKPLQDVLTREKRRAYKKAEQRGKEALAEYKKKAESKYQESAEKWRENRKKAVAKARETAEKREAREKLQKLVLDTAKWLSYPAKTDVKCPDLLKKPYADFLNSIDMSSARLANGGDPTKNDLRLANAMTSLATALERVMTSQDPTKDATQEATSVLDAGYLDLPVNFVQMLRDMTEKVTDMMVEGEYVVNNMTASEIRKLSQMIRTLNHAIREMSTLYANLRFANVEALGDESMSFMDDLGEIQKTGGVKDFVKWDNALPFYAFKRFGKGGESIFEGLMDAQDKLAFLAQEIFNFQKKTWKADEAKKWSEDTHTISLPDGDKLTLTTGDAMTIYCLFRRDQGLKHLLGGGVRVLGIKKGSQKAKDSRSTLTANDIDVIISSLTDRQKKVAEDIQEFLSTRCAEWGNEVSEKRFLTKEFTEKNYFPIESNDENLPMKDPSAQQSDLFRLLNISATKPINPDANNEVIIRNIFDVFTDHASDMARLNAFGLPLLDYMKWLNYREKTVSDNGQVKVRGVRKSMETSFGNAAKSYVLNLIKDVNGRPSDNGDPSILMKWMRTAKTASVGNSVRVAALQITSYPRAALVLSPKSLALGLSKIPRIEKAKKYCGIALWKSFGFYDTNISRSIEDQMKGVTDIRQKLIELSLKGAELGDAITWGALWNACEYEVASTKKYKVGTEEFYDAVGKKLREVVYRTQVVDSTLTRSQIMRSKRGMAQEAAAFMSEPTVSANILMDAGMEFSMEKRRTNAKTAWKKTGKYVGRAIAVYSIGQLTAALMEGLFDAWRDDDDEEFGEKYMSAFVENLALDLVPFNKIPIVSDVFEAVLAMADIGYYSSDKMSTTWLTQAVSAADAWRDVMGGQSSTTTYNALYKTVRAVSSFYGVSFSGVMREAVALWNNTIGAYDLTKKILTYDRSKSELGNLLLDALIEGDDRQADSLRGEFEDNDAIQSAIRSAVKNRYDEEEIDRDTTIQYLVNYGGLKMDEAVQKIDEWGFKTEYNFAWSDRKEAYLDGKISASDLKTALIEVGGKDAEEADEYIEKLDFEKEYGFAYDDRNDAYKDGEISKYELKAILMEFGGKTAEEADLQIEAYDWEADGYEGATAAAVREYNEHCAGAGVPKDIYLNIRRFSNNTENDVDKATGKTIYYSAMKKVMAEINAQPITNGQKDAIARSLGWSEKNIQKYKPW